MTDAPMARRRNPWVGVGWVPWMRAAEIAAVIGLCTLMLAGVGLAADADTRRMISEKMTAA